MQEEKLRLFNELDEARADDLASAATVEIGYATGNLIHITGTTTITSLGAARQAGVRRVVVFDGALTLTHGSSLLLPGLADITTAAGDRAIFVAETPTIWRCVSYVKDSAAPQSATTAEVNTLDGVQDPIVAANGVQAYLTIDGGVDGNDGITYTAVSYDKATGEAITIEHLGGVSQTYAITVTDTLISVQLETDGGGVVVTTPGDIVATFATPVTADEILAASMVTAALSEGDGTSIAGVAAEAPLDNGVDVTAGSIGAIRFKADGTEAYMKVSAQVWKKWSLSAL